MSVRLLLSVLRRPKSASVALLRGLRKRSGASATQPDFSALSPHTRGLQLVRSDAVARTMLGPLDGEIRVVMAQVPQRTRNTRPATRWMVRPSPSITGPRKRASNPREADRGNGNYASKGGSVGSSGGRGSGEICGSGEGRTSGGCGCGSEPGSGTRSGPGGSGTGTGTPGPGLGVLGSSIRIVHRLALVLGSRLVFADRVVHDCEPPGACDTDARRAAAVGLFRALTRRLAGAEAPTDVRNGHLVTLTWSRRGYERSGYGSLELSPPDIASHSCGPEQPGHGGNDFTDDVSSS